MDEYLYITTVGKLSNFFKDTIHKVKVPSKVDMEWLASVGYTDKHNDRKFIPLLKELEFIDENGKPTDAYSEFRDENKSKTVMEKVLKKAYSELYVTYEDPFGQDDATISNFIKIKKNYSQRVADEATRTFRVLAASAGLIEDQKTPVPKHNSPKSTKPSRGVKKSSEPPEKQNAQESQQVEHQHHNNPFSFAVNVQFVLPETKDPEVYRNLFSELRKFLTQNSEHEN